MHACCKSKLSWLLSRSKGCIQLKCNSLTLLGIAYLLPVWSNMLRVQNLCNDAGARGWLSSKSCLVVQCATQAQQVMCGRALCNLRQ